MSNRFFSTSEAWEAALDAEADKQHGDYTLAYNVIGDNPFEAQVDTPVEQDTLRPVQHVQPTEIGGAVVRLVRGSAYSPKRMVPIPGDRDVLPETPFDELGRMQPGATEAGSSSGYLQATQAFQDIQASKHNNSGTVA